MLIVVVESAGFYGTVVNVQFTGLYSTVVQFTGLYSTVVKSTGLWTVVVAADFKILGQPTVQNKSNANC